MCVCVCVLCHTVANSLRRHRSILSLGGFECGLLDAMRIFAKYSTYIQSYIYTCMYTLRGEGVVGL